MADRSPDDLSRLALLREEAIRAKREGVLLIRRPLRPGDTARSFIGGLPWLPEHLDWPVRESTGLPFNFIAQIDLCDLPRPEGVFFPAEGMLWFFAVFSDEQFSGDDHTCVLFDPRARIEAAERQAPANLPPLHPGGDPHGWGESRHPHAFVAPKAGLSMHLIDTFHDWFHCEDPHERTFEPVVYMKMIDELREEALRRAIGVDRSQRGYGYPHQYREIVHGSPLYLHQMFGHGSSPQGATESYEDYVLLLQLGGSRTLGLPVMGDAAMHYWIPREDLARGRFDRVEGTWEAG